MFCLRIAVWYRLSWARRTCAPSYCLSYSYLKFTWKTFCLAGNLRWLNPSLRLGSVQHCFLWLVIAVLFLFSPQQHNAKLVQHLKTRTHKKRNITNSTLKITPKLSHIKQKGNEEEDLDEDDLTLCEVAILKSFTHDEKATPSQNMVPRAKQKGNQAERQFIVTIAQTIWWTLFAVVTLYRKS